MFDVNKLSKGKAMILVFLSIIAGFAVGTDTIGGGTGKIGVSDELETYAILTLPIPVDFVQDVVDRLREKGLPDERIEQLIKDLNHLNVNYGPYLQIEGKRHKPILFTDPDKDIIAKLENFDGILLTGGDTLFDLEPFERDGLLFYKTDSDKPSTYLRKIKAILDKAKDINKKGRYFPLFGICLGFEAILLVESNLKFPIAFVNQNNVTSSVRLTDSPTKFRKGFNDTDANALKSKSLMFFFHDLGFLPSDFMTFDTLADNYSIAAVNPAGDYGDEIAAFQHNTLPVFGVQFHPEKTLFEQSPFYNIDRSDEAIDLAYKFGTVLLDRRNRIQSKKTKSVKTHDEDEFYKVTVHIIGTFDRIDLFSRNRDILFLAD